jgi:hypothetical protein
VLSLTGLQDVDHSPLGIGIAALSLLVMHLVLIGSRRARRSRGRAGWVSVRRTTATLSDPSPQQEDLVMTSTKWNISITGGDGRRGDEGNAIKQLVGRVET